MQNKIIPYTRHTVTAEDIAAVHEVLQSDYITRGPVVEQFETALAAYCDSKYAVAVHSGTAALHLAYKALGLSRGDSVLSPPITFAATMNAALYEGASPLFVDVEPEFITLDPEKLKDFLKRTPPAKHPKIITGVSLAGHPYKMEKIWNIARKYEIKVVADQSHALGSSWYDSQNKLQFAGNGTYADVEICSFQATKNMTTGEGGALLTNNADLYEQFKVLRNHGFKKSPNRQWEYDMHSVGYNYHMTEFQAALGLQQLYKLNDFIRRRQQIARFYDQHFKGLKNIRRPLVAANVNSARHLYSIQIPNRDDVYRQLRKQGIYCQVHYKPIHLLSYYQKHYPFARGDFPKSEQYFDTSLSIPMFPSLSAEEMAWCASQINKAVNEKTYSAT